jgi:hypothetical protein
LLEVGEYRVGFDQVFLGFGLAAAGRHPLDTIDGDRCASGLTAGPSKTTGKMCPQG